MISLGKKISELVGSNAEAARQAIIDEGPSIVPRLLEHLFRLYTEIPSQEDDDPEYDALENNMNLQIAVEAIIFSFGTSAIPHIQSCIEQIRAAGMQFIQSGVDRFSTDPDDPNVYSYRRNHSSPAYNTCFIKYCDKLVAKIKAANSPVRKAYSRVRGWLSPSK